MKMEHDLVKVTLTLSGPADVWFGVGFGASTMNDKPYAIIVDGNGKVTERKLENHGPGTLLANSVNGNNHPLTKVLTILWNIRWHQLTFWPEFCQHT